MLKGLRWRVEDPTANVDQTAIVTPVAAANEIDIKLYIYKLYIYGAYVF